MTDITQKIKNRIYELLPDLKELKRGCEVSYNNRLEIVSGFSDNFSDDWVKTDAAMRKISELEILGQPLGLPEILRAIPHLEPNDKFPPFRNIIVGQAESVGNQGFMEVISLWNLKETFDNQSEEVKKLVGTLLGIKDE